MSHWIFQANPKHFDIDGALGALTQIHWRVPQYTGAIAPGDAVVLWRSGRDAGVVGVGRVMGAPADLPILDAERRFVVDPHEEGHRTTRVPLSVRCAEFVPKSRVAALSGWTNHQIITAPMGTVFPVGKDEWEALGPLLPAIPPFAGTVATGLVPAFSWEQRKKDVYPLPGGYTGYFRSLGVILGEVVASQPTREDLEKFVVADLSVTPTSAHLSVGFLLRMGMLRDASGVVSPGDVAAAWLDDHDPLPVIALLHSRVRFIGELLAEIVEPKTDGELLDIANRYYGAGWQTKAQIRRRRGWLESAGTMEEGPDGRLVATVSGRSLVASLELRHGTHERTPAAYTTPDPGPEPPVTVVEEIASEVRTLIDRLKQSGSDGTDPGRFERETAEVFRRLGFDSQWIGGSGKTDVLLEAPLGRDASYRVVVDCKSTARGTVSQQIDWDTIDEHREQHRANYAAVVAPGFGGGRLAERAERHQAIMLTVDDLGELLIQHSKTPLSLDAYRLLFTAQTTEDGMAAIGEAAQEAQRRVELMDAVLELLNEYGPQMGALSARDLTLLLMTSEGLPDATENEIAEVVAALSAPLIGALAALPDGSVRLAGSLSRTAQVLRALADRLDFGSEHSSDTG